MADDAGASNDDGSIKEQDMLLPIANVGRIMKQILPPNAKISKESKETMQECASEFISFVTGEASEKCKNERRKTVNGDDICWAIGTLGFDDYAGPLRRYLHKYRELEGEKANNDQDQDRTQNSNPEEVRVDPSSYGSYPPTDHNQAVASAPLKFNLSTDYKSNTSTSRPY